ncbi:MAG: hypothetical protein K5694_00960 [Bacilli bacterium]|nr:hypothetical protein [Bacilli bacterium]
MKKIIYRLYDVTYGEKDNLQPLSEKEFYVEVVTMDVLDNIIVKIDRVLDHAVIISCMGKSYELKEDEKIDFEAEGEDYIHDGSAPIYHFEIEFIGDKPKTPKEAEARRMFEKALRYLKDGGDSMRSNALTMIQEAADMGLEDAKDWIDDNFYSDDGSSDAES